MNKLLNFPLGFFLAQMPATPVPAPEIEGDIRDIRGPISIPETWTWIILGLGILIILSLFGYYLWKWWKSKHVVVPRKAHEIALDRLQEALALMSPEKAREFSIAVSDAVRTYIEDRFQEKAAHYTTEEFLHSLLSKPSSPLSAFSVSLTAFLNHCDLAKFARWTLSLNDMQSMHTSARKLIEETRSDLHTSPPQKQIQAPPPFISETPIPTSPP
jgi:hypothetical protein